MAESVSSNGSYTSTDTTSTDISPQARFEIANRHLQTYTQMFERATTELEVGTRRFNYISALPIGHPARGELQRLANLLDLLRTQIRDARRWRDDAVDRILEAERDIAAETDSDSPGQPSQEEALANEAETTTEEALEVIQAGPTSPEMDSSDQPSQGGASANEAEAITEEEPSQGRGILKGGSSFRGGRFSEAGKSTQAKAGCFGRGRRRGLLRLERFFQEGTELEGLDWRTRGCSFY